MQSQPGICLKTYRVPPESERLPRGKWYNALILMVGAEGFEPPTLCSQSRCATRLRYAPIARLYRNQLSSGMVSEPLEEPKDEEDRGQEDGGQGNGNDQEEDPISPGLAPRLLQMAGDERIVATIRLPGNVKQIAQQGHCSQQHFNPDIDHHSDQGDVGNTAYPRRNHDDRRSKAAKDVSQPGNEADDAINAKANRGAGNAKPVIENMRQQVEIFVGKQAVCLLKT
jgi:hypothetical protein